MRNLNSITVRTSDHGRAPPGLIRRLVLLGLVALVTLAGAGRAWASGITLGTLDDYTLLALNNGSLSINSATSITGVVGYSSGVSVPSAQKVDTFTGTVYVYSGTATSNLYSTYASATFAPSGGIHSGDPLLGCPSGFVCDGATVNNMLTQANADAVSLQNQFDALYTAGPVSNLGTVSSNLSLTGGGGINLYDASWAMNTNTLTLSGGASDWFIFRTSSTSNSWADSQVILGSGVDPNHVWFYFTGSGTNLITINKATTDFTGNILAPNGQIIYHNPATFDGRIIAKDLLLHSDFNIAGLPPEPPVTVPEPGTMLLVASGLLGLAGARGRKLLV